MKNILSFLLVAFIGIFSFTSGQSSPDSIQSAALTNLREKMNNGLGVVWNEKTGTPDIIRFAIPHSFSSDHVASAKLFLKEIKGVLKAEIDDELVLQRTNKDDDIQYIRFDQFYKNIPVCGGEYLVTVLPEGKIQSASGKFHKNISIDIKPKIDAKEAFTTAKQNVPKNVILKDTISLSQLVIYPKDNVYFLAWKLKIPSSQEGEELIYVIDAVNGTVLSQFSTVINETVPLMRPQPQGNVYLHHPYIDASYSYLSPINVDNSGYIQGTYANVVNDATSRAYNSISDFTYSTSDTHFDEMNLFYHIDNFRRNFWNGLGFNSFIQITAHAHTYFAYGPNASYSTTDHHLRFSDGQGVSGYNSFAREDKTIMHEYTHGVTDYIANLSPGYTETGAIHEGNSDYFSGTFTGRSLSGEYISPGYPINQRNMISPRIATFSQYNDQNLSYWQQYGYHEPHFGGELWSAALWDLRLNSHIGSTMADFLIYKGLLGIPTSSTFLQYRQAIMNADINYGNSLNIKHIAHSFYTRGIGTDSLGFGGIDGPEYLAFKQQGTYTAENITGGSGSRSYQWYVQSGSSWVATGTAQTQTMRMVTSDIVIRCDVHDNVTGEIASAQKTIYYGQPLPKIGGDNEDTKTLTEIPKGYSLLQNHPNPFNPSTTIAYMLPEDGFVSLKIYNTLGEVIATLVNDYKSAGYYSLDWNSSNLPSGLYFYQILAGKFTATKKMLLTK
ncbi:MAG: M36 family metallopeptidase [Ignavibacteriaceae bacterium]|jgi:Zn-dependent metalloprotease